MTPLRRARTARFVAVATLLAAAAACEREEPRDYTVVAALPHDAGAYTQGLLWKDGVFYESTGRYGYSDLRRVDPATGRVLDARRLPGNRFGEGIAILGDRLYQLTWKEQVAYVYQLPMMQLVDSVRYEGEGWGLTSDGESLIMSDGSATLRFLDPQTFAVRRTLEVTSDGAAVQQLNELEMIRGEIWANIYTSDYVVRIDPATGAVRQWIDFQGLLPDSLRRADTDVFNGIAWDSAGERLFVTGKLWPRVFEVGVDAPVTP